MIALEPPGGWEVLVILLVVLLIFGAKRLPEIGKGMGKGIKEFRDATKGLADDVRAGAADDDRPPTKPSAPPAPSPDDRSAGGPPSS